MKRLYRNWRGGRPSLTRQQFPAEFYRAVAEDREPPIDVYDGPTWSALLPLSAQSIRESNRSLEMPDFTRGKWKNRKFEGFGIEAA